MRGDGKVTGSPAPDTRPRPWWSTSDARIAAVAVILAIVVAGIVWITDTESPVAEEHDGLQPEQLSDSDEVDALEATSEPAGDDTERAEGVQSVSTGFDRDAAVTVEMLQIDVHEMRTLLDQGVSIRERIAAARDRVGLLYSLPAPTNAADSWSAGLAEVDEWIAMLDSADKSGADDQRYEALRALDPLLSLLGSLAIAHR